MKNTYLENAVTYSLNKKRMINDSLAELWKADKLQHKGRNIKKQNREIIVELEVSIRLGLLGHVSIKNRVQKCPTFDSRKVGDYFRSYFTGGDIYHLFSKNSDNPLLHFVLRLVLSIQSSTVFLQWTNLILHFTD